ncbi:hypothetical protein YPPY72_1989, partial [Yersinia pestis PY-72]
MIPAMHRYN